MLSRPNILIENNYLIKELFLKFLILIDLLGLFFWINGGVDEYGMAYGRHYEYVHGLSMINTYVFLWFLMKYLFTKQLSLKEWIVFGYISFSIIACSYGLGYICLLLTFVVLLILRH